MTARQVKAVSSVLAAFALVGAAPALCAEPRGDLGAVEDAYREVDFEAVRRLAESAIHSGGHDPASTARLEFLLAVANAALDQQQEAKRAFVVLLGIDPSQKLERELSPRLRAPYLEARGFWSSNPERLSASARADAGQLSVSLSDPAKMVSQVRVRFRAAGQREYRESLQPAAATVRVAVPSQGTQELECAITLLDEFGNTLSEHGTNLVPLRLRREGPTSSEQRFAQLPAARGPNYLLPGALFVLGAAGAATGVYFHVQRERAAREWNGRACERPGATRGEQCGDVERRLGRDQWLAVGLYAGGGALLTLGVVSLVANQARGREQPSAAVSCDAVAASTLGVWCAGRF